MPRWKKDEKDFTVKVSYEEKRGYQSYVPKPVMEALGQPETITYSLKGKRVEVRAGTHSEPKKS